MATHATTYEFSVAGVRLKVRSANDEKTVQELMNFVDDKISEAMQSTKSGSLQNAAILAALNIAEELYAIKEEARKELDDLERKAVRISSALESSRLSKLGLDT